MPTLGAYAYLHPQAAFHPFGMDKWEAKLLSDEFYLALVAPLGEYSRGKGLPDRIVGK